MGSTWAAQAKSFTDRIALHGKRAEFSRCRVLVNQMEQQHLVSTNEKLTRDQALELGLGAFFGDDVRTLNLLEKAGYSDVRHLAFARPEELMESPNVTERTIELIEKLVWRRIEGTGLSWRGDWTNGD